MRDLKELAHWLEGDSTEAKAWRLKKENLNQVSEMINDYASQIGGRSASEVWARVKAEKKRAASKKAAIEKEQKQRDALVESVRLDYLANGGSAKDWDSRSNAIIEGYAINGRAKGLQAKQEAYKRSLAARTF